MERTKKIALKTIYLSFVSNLIIALIKGVVGFFGNSYALIADAIESTTDVFASIFVWVGLKYAMKPADQNHPYGHGKAEPLVTFIVVAFLLSSAVLIAFQSIHNIQTPHEGPKSYTLYVLGSIIIIKEILYRTIAKKGEELKSTSLKAEAWHHRSDAITSITAFIGIAIAVLMGEGYENADDWAALIASGAIVFNAYLIFRPALAEVMDEDIHENLINELRDCAMQVKGVLDTEKCFVRKAGFRYYVDLHVVVAASITVKEGHDIAHIVKTELIHNFDYIEDVLIHIEPFNEYHYATKTKNPSQ